jgi:hypothetical protein
MCRNCCSQQSTAYTASPWQSYLHLVWLVYSQAQLTQLLQHAPWRAGHSRTPTVPAGKLQDRGNSNICRHDLMLTDKLTNRGDCWPKIMRRQTAICMRIGLVLQLLKTLQAQQALSCKSTLVTSCMFDVKHVSTTHEPHSVRTSHHAPSQSRGPLAMFCCTGIAGMSEAD